MKVTAKDLGKLEKTPLVVVFVTEGVRPQLPAEAKVPAAFAKDYEAKPRATRTTFASSGPAERVLLVGLGAAKKVDVEGLRRAGATAAKTAEGLGVARAVLRVDDKIAKLAGGPEVVGRALSEGAVMGSYRYSHGKSKPEKPKCAQLALHGSGAAFKRAVKKGAALAESNCFTRDLQNQAGNQMTPSALAAAARKLATRSPRITTKVMDEKGMRTMGMGLLLGVSQGSTQPAKLVHMTYKPKGRSKGKVCFVGKGLTFDAGGISIKPSAKMDEMRYDMSGGAAVLGAFHALASVDVPYEVHGVVACSENLIDGNATKPGDVHKGMNGTTVEINNTDAEGRLILADALTYTGKKIKPDTIIDLATLTGAVIVGLGHEVSGIFPTTDKLRDELVAAGESVGERCWPLPLFDMHKEGMKGKSGDLSNIGSPAMGAGSTQGAAFLSYFVDDDTEWCHIDIAGTAWNTADRGWVGGALGSGVGARLLIEYLETRR
ncbi:MAG: leucyl aminopeptidase [bacterium]|nr:leucyl aminopeptidase [bacterium]